MYLSITCFSLTTPFVRSTHIDTLLSISLVFMHFSTDGHLDCSLLFVFAIANVVKEQVRSIAPSTFSGLSDNLIVSLCRGISALAHSQVLEEAVFTYTLRLLNQCYYIQIQNFPLQRSASPWGHEKQPYIFVVVENSLESDNDSVQNMVTHVKFWFYPSLLPGNTMLSCCQHQMLVTPIKLLKD